MAKKQVKRQPKKQSKKRLRKQPQKQFQQQKKRLNPLKPGDTVDVVAPSGFVDKKVLKDVKAYLQSLGLKARIPQDLLNRDLFFANSDKRRAQILQSALSAKDSAAVWALRGGSGGQRLLPFLKNLRLARNKIFIGLSDISVFHHLLNKKGIPSLHAPILTRMGKKHQPRPERKEIEELLFGRLDELAFLKLEAINGKAKRTQVIKAEVCGGNICVLHALNGSASAFKGKGKIVFLEEVNEEPYRIDRMLQSLLQAGAFEKARAIAFGDFVDCARTTADKRVLKEALARFAEQVKVPVVAGLSSGHGKLQRPILFGTSSYLHLGSKPKLIIPSCIYE